MSGSLGVAASSGRLRVPVAALGSLASAAVSAVREVMGDGSRHVSTWTVNSGTVPVLRTVPLSVTRPSSAT